MSVFLKANPVPWATARNGSSGICTGSLVFCFNLWLSPLSKDPPPVKYMPVLYMSADNSGGVLNKAALTASSILSIVLFRAFAISL